MWPPCRTELPHALELSKRGYNAFALIYRPGAETACEDLARAIAFYTTTPRNCKLTWTATRCGALRRARMAAWLGSYGTAAFGEKEYPRPGAVIMQYTGLSEVYGNEPPTYNCVGTADGIANYRIMQRRIEAILRQGTPAEIDIYPGLAHGFGLGEGTSGRGLARPRRDILAGKYLNREHKAQMCPNKAPLRFYYVLGINL